MLRNDPSHPSAVAIHRDNTQLILFLSARVSSVMAYQMLSVAVGWHIYALTGSPFYLGLVGLAQFFPLFLLALIVGHVADRYERRTVGRLCQLFESAGVAVLAAGNLAGWLNAHLILGIVLLIGGARAFEAPTMQAFLPNLVSRDRFPKAVAWATSSSQTAVIVGPALGGFLYAANPSVAYLAIVVLFAGASLVTSRIKGGRVKKESSTADLRSVFAGITFIRANPAILGAISLDLFAVLLGGATALLPVYARDILCVGPWGLGLLRSAPAVGALAMSISLARHPLQSRIGRTMFLAVIVFGMATILFALSTSLIVSLISLVILGAADVTSVVIRQFLVQIRTPDNMRGRVAAVNSVFIGTSNQLGEFESGLTAAWFGVVPAVLIGGIGSIIIALGWMRLFPELLHVDKAQD
ncbi:MAG TPA: MFS transporter [Syntrophorhabdaceae bacterium]|nr:MFS transporter [Syntrophorhabdaceae bacterium]